MKLLLVAGEVSGDQHAAALLTALKKRVESLELFGLGGDQTIALGLKPLAHQRDLAVVGLVEAIGKIRFARRLVKRLVAAAVEEKADAAVLIDSPDFNLPLARRLAKAGVPVIFYVSPQVWAWRSGRARKIDRLGRALLTLFRFEKAWYEARGLGSKVTWVGHPLVDAATAELAEVVPPAPAGVKRVVVMPGSRSGEVRKLLPLLANAVEVLRASHPALEVVLVRADSIEEGLLRGAAGAVIESWRIVSGPHLSLLRSADVLLVASGTATVEGLLARVPMVVVYKVHRLSFVLAKMLVKVKYVAMANLLSDDGSGTPTVPELVQDDATPERVAAEAAAFLDDPAKAARTREALARGATELGEPGAADRAAEALLRVLSLKRSDVSKEDTAGAAEGKVGKHA